jgi:hypothetical protein
VPSGESNHHWTILNNSFHLGQHSSNITSNYPLDSVPHGSLRCSATPHQQLASQPSSADIPLPYSASLRKPSPNPCPGDAKDGAAAASAFLSALASSQPKESRVGERGGGDQAVCGRSKEPQERGRDLGRPLHPPGKAVLDAAVRPPRARTPAPVHEIHKSASPPERAPTPAPVSHQPTPSSRSSSKHLPCPSKRHRPPLPHHRRGRLRPAAHAPAPAAGGARHLPGPAAGRRPPRRAGAGAERGAGGAARGHGQDDT